MSADPPVTPWRIYAPRNPALCINRSDGAPLVEINLRTGEVTIHDEARVDEAAERFWEAVRELGKPW